MDVSAANACVSSISCADIDVDTFYRSRQTSRRRCFSAVKDAEAEVVESRAADAVSCRSQGG